MSDPEIELLNKLYWWYFTGAWPDAEQVSAS